VTGPLAGLSGTGKIAATVTTIVGSLGILASVLSAFGLDMTEQQLTALVGLGGVLTTLAGLWLNPGVPVGVVTPVGIGAGQHEEQSAAVTVPVEEPPVTEEGT
jgi:hypothetical protein